MKQDSKNMKRIQRFILVTVLLCLFGIISAQTIPKVRITGRVRDAFDNQPLFFVQVYLANTSLGCTTDMDGKFTIERIPLGNYQLIVSLMGYERLERDIQLIRNKDQKFSFSLRPIVLEGGEVSISAPHPREWQRNLARFERLFIGSSDFARQCRILNPEVLSFKRDKRSGILTASSIHPLQIENRAVGFIISYTLKNFAVQDGMFLRYTGYTYFQEMEPESDRDVQKWNENRNRVFYGSVRHFVISLIQNRLKEEGYELIQASDIPLTERMIQFREMEGDTLVYTGATPYERTLKLPQFMRIIYTGELEERSYYKESDPKITRLNKKITGQVSWLEVNQPSVYTNLSGHIDNPYALTLYGYWAWEAKISNMLPLDFTPDSIANGQFPQ